MTKKDTLAAVAERMFVIDQMSAVEIGSQLKLSERYIRKWKDEFNWDEKRAQYVNSKKMFHEELYIFARKLMESISYDMDNQEKIDPGRMFAFTKMLPLINKIKEYEDDVTKEKSDEKQSKKEITPDFIKLINEEFLGIKSDE